MNAFWKTIIAVFLLVGVLFYLANNETYQKYRQQKSEAFDKAMREVNAGFE